MVDQRKENEQVADFTKNVIEPMIRQKRINVRNVAGVKQERGGDIDLLSGLTDIKSFLAQGMTGELGGVGEDVLEQLKEINNNAVTANIADQKLMRNQIASLENVINAIDTSTDEGALEKERILEFIRNSDKALKKNTGFMNSMLDVLSENLPGLSGIATAILGDSPLAGVVVNSLGSMFQKRRDEREKSESRELELLMKRQDELIEKGQRDPFGASRERPMDRFDEEDAFDMLSMADGGDGGDDPPDVTAAADDDDDGPVVIDRINSVGNVENVENVEKIGGKDPEDISDLIDALGEDSVDTSPEREKAMFDLIDEKNRQDEILASLPKDIAALFDGITSDNLDVLAQRLDDKFPDGIPEQVEEKIHDAWMRLSDVTMEPVREGMTDLQEGLEDVITDTAQESDSKVERMGDLMDEANELEKEAQSERNRRQNDKTEEVEGPKIDIEKEEEGGISDLLLGMLIGGRGKGIMGAIRGIATGIGVGLVKFAKFLPRLLFGIFKTVLVPLIVGKGLIDGIHDAVDEWRESGHLGQALVTGLVGMGRSIAEVFGLNTDKIADWFSENEILDPIFEFFDRVMDLATSPMETLETFTQWLGQKSNDLWSSLFSGAGNLFSFLTENNPATLLRGLAERSLALMRDIMSDPGGLVADTAEDIKNGVQRFFVSAIPGWFPNRFLPRIVREMREEANREPPRDEMDQASVPDGQAVTREQTQFEADVSRIAREVAAERNILDPSDSILSGQRRDPYDPWSQIQFDDQPRAELDMERPEVERGDVLTRSERELEEMERRRSRDSGQKTTTVNSVSNVDASVRQTIIQQRNTYNDDPTIRGLF